jgi:hypothetical protein
MRTARTKEIWSPKAQRIQRINYNSNLMAQILHTINDRRHSDYNVFILCTVN